MRGGLALMVGMAVAMAAAGSALSMPGGIQDTPGIGGDGFASAQSCSSVACFLENLLAGLCISACIG